MTIVPSEKRCSIHCHTTRLQGQLLSPSCETPKHILNTSTMNSLFFWLYFLYIWLFIKKTNRNVIIKSYIAASCEFPDITRRNWTEQCPYSSSHLTLVAQLPGDAWLAVTHSCSVVAWRGATFIALALCDRHRTHSLMRTLALKWSHKHGRKGCFWTSTALKGIRLSLILNCDLV